MCKLMFIVGTNKPKEAREFLKAAAPKLSVGNSDGLGYTAIKNDGNIFTERWLKNGDAFNGDPITERDKDIITSLDLFIDSPSLENYTIQGDKEWSKVTSVMMHTRMKTTGEISIKNTHPFVCNDNEFSIVHNGCIRNHNMFCKLNSTCDSEVILTEYMNNEVNLNPENVTNLVEQFEGYWAVGATSKDNEGNRIIDIFTSNKGSGSGSLVCTYVEHLNALVFASNERLINDTFESLKIKHENRIFEVNKDCMARFDAITGECKQLIHYPELGTSYGYKNTGGTSSGKYQGGAKTSTTNTGTNGTSSTTANNRGSLSLEQSGDNTGGRVNRGTNVVGSVDVGASCTRQFLVTALQELSEKATNTIKEVTSTLKDADSNKESLPELPPALPPAQDLSYPRTNFSALEGLANIQSGFEESSDSKYYKEITEAEKEELEELMDELTEMEKAELNALPEDMMYACLNQLKDERQA